MKAGWLLVAILAVLNGIEGLRYALPHVPFAAPLPNFTLRREWLVAHAVFPSIALLTGPWQLSTRLRLRSLDFHR